MGTKSPEQILKDLASEDGKVRREAILAIQVQNRTDAIPSLIPMLGDGWQTDGWEATDNSQIAKITLIQFRGASIPFLIQALDSKDERIRENAVSALGKMGCIAEPALPILKTMAAHFSKVATEAKAKHLRPDHTNRLDSMARICAHAIRSIRAELNLGFGHDVSGGHWITVGACPRGGDWLGVDIQTWKSKGVTVVVSLLQSGETRELGLQQESDCCGNHGLIFESMPIDDRGTPDSMQGAIQFLRRLRNHLRDGQSLYIHCRQGLGRAPMIAAALLVVDGWPSKDALIRIRKDRGVQVPETHDQSVWIEKVERVITMNVYPESAQG